MWNDVILWSCADSTTAKCFLTNMEKINVYNILKSVAVARYESRQRSYYTRLTMVMAGVSLEHNNVFVRNRTLSFSTRNQRSSCVVWYNIK